MVSPHRSQPTRSTRVLDTAGLQLHLVDLRRTSPGTLATATAMRAQAILIDLDPQQTFDAVIHVRDITPAHGATDQPQE